MNILFDIGCNKGLYTDANIDNYDKIILVDANPYLINYLKNKYHSINKIVILNNIVSNKDKEVFYLCDQGDTISTSDREWITNSRFSNSHSWNTSIDITTISIDTIIRLYGIPKRIKIDVEGYELNVIKSLTLKNEELCFEWAEEKKKDMIEIINYLLNLGYTQFHIQYEDKYDYIPKNFINYEEIIYWIENKLKEDRKEKWGMIWCK